MMPPLKSTTLSELFTQLAENAKRPLFFGWFCVAVLVALGFKFRTPAAEYQALTFRTDSLYDQVHELRQQRDSEFVLLQSIVRLECVRASATEIALAGVSCSTGVR